MASEGPHALASKVAHLKITPDVLAMIAELDEFKGGWRAIGRLAPDRLASLRKVATIESIGSSTRIEGAKLTDREVEQLLTKVEVKSLKSRDEQVVAGYAGIMDTIFGSADAIAITENNIRQLHRDLLQHSSKDARHRGEYKALPNHVEAFGPDGQRLGVVSETATPFETPRRMEALVNWTTRTTESAELHPLLVIAVFTVEFLAIHPFQDGNGRLSRALTTLQLLRSGYAYAPCSSLESVIEQSKEACYLALRQTQGTLRSDSPDWAPWLRYILAALKAQKDRLATKLEREQAVFGSLPDLSVSILELATSHGRVTIPEAVQATGASRNTLKDHFSSLVTAGLLRRHGAGRGTWYSA